MVQWKGNIDREEAGEKAANLDSLGSFEVPNFFVLTSSEIREVIGSKDARKIANSQMPDELVSKVKEAYQDVGMSSEVRNASGQARDLVGNQRESQRVSVRVSENSNLAEYQLNVGASGLEEAIRNVLASYMKNSSEIPAIIFQKMIEPEYSGSIVRRYNRTHSLVELVEGLGHSLEEGITVPEFYAADGSNIIESRVPDSQVKVSRNPMNGQRRTRTVSKGSPAIQKSEVRDLLRKATREDLSVKFVRKRGTFYAVDAFKSPRINDEPDLEALKVSDGEIEGREGEDYIVSDELRETSKPLVSRKGGFTSTEAQRKRAQNVPAIVSLKEESKLKKADSEDSGGGKSPEEPQRHREIGDVSAVDIRPLKEFPGLSENPFSFQSSEESFVDTCEQLLAEEPDLIDGRSIDDRALIKCLQLLDEVKVLAVENPSDEILSEVVRQGVGVLAAPDQEIEGVRGRVLRQEKKFIMDRLRN